MCGPQTTSARMTGGGFAMANPYECRGNGIRAIRHVLPEQLRFFFKSVTVPKNAFQRGYRQV